MFIIGIPHFNNPIQKFISPDTKNDDMCKNILEDFQKVMNILRLMKYILKK